MAYCLVPAVSNIMFFLVIVFVLLVNLTAAMRRVDNSALIFTKTFLSLKRNELSEKVWTSTVETFFKLFCPATTLTAVTTAITIETHFPMTLWKLLARQEPFFSFLGLFCDESLVFAISQTTTRSGSSTTIPKQSLPNILSSTVVSLFVSSAKHTAVLTSWIPGQKQTFSKTIYIVSQLLGFVGLKKCKIGLFLFLLCSGNGCNTCCFLSDFFWLLALSRRWFSSEKIWFERRELLSRIQAKPNGHEFQSTQAGRFS